jgi:hypothetical protein
MNGVEPSINSSAVDLGVDPSNAWRTEVEPSTGKIIYKWLGNFIEHTTLYLARH